MIPPIDSEPLSAAPENRNRTAELTLLSIAAVWGTTFALLRDSMRVLHPYDVMALRFTIATLILVALYWRRIGAMRRLWLWDGVRTGFFLTAGYLTQVIGLQTTPSARSAFITSTALVFVPFVAYAIQRTRTGLGDAVGVGVAFVGLLVFYAEANFSLRPGDLWMLGCAIAFAIQIVTTNIAGRRSDTVVVTVLQLAFAAVVGWVLVAARGGLAAPVAAIPWTNILYLGVIATAVILPLQTWALGKTAPVRAGVIYTTEPIFAAVFAAAFFAEGASVREIVGGAIILAAVLVSDLWGSMGAFVRARTRR